MRTPAVSFTLVLGLFTAAGCAHTLEGTRVADTEDGRAIVEILSEVRAALEARDADGILRHVSLEYFEEQGNSDPSDDYGYEQLKTRWLPESLDVAREIYVTFEVQEVVIEGDTAHADIRYNSRARLDLPSGELWESQREFDRVRFAREDGAWMITGGL